MATRIDMEVKDETESFDEFKTCNKEHNNFDSFACKYSGSSDLLKDCKQSHMIDSCRTETICNNTDQIETIKADKCVDDFEDSSFDSPEYKYSNSSDFLKDCEQKKTPFLKPISDQSDAIESDNVHVKTEEIEDGKVNGSIMCVNSLEDAACDRSEDKYSNSLVFLTDCKLEKASNLNREESCVKKLSSKIETVPKSVDQAEMKHEGGGSSSEGADGLPDACFVKQDITCLDNIEIEIIENKLNEQIKSDNSVDSDGHDLFNWKYSQWSVNNVDDVAGIKSGTIHGDSSYKNVKIRGSIIQHVIRNRHGDGCKTFQCKLCEVIFKHKASFYHHYRVKHDVNSKVLQCSSCHYNTREKYILVQHIKHKHSVRRDIFQCKLCECSYKSGPSLSNHIKIKHDVTSEVFHCENCDYITRIKKNLIQHIKRNHSQSFQCELCEHSFKDRRDLRRHIKMKDNVNREVLRCANCHYITRSRVGLVQHIKCRHNKRREIFQCKVCDSSFKSNQGLSHHTKNKHDVNSEVLHCGKCDFITRLRHLLLQHIRCKHSQIKEILECKLCDSSFKSKNGLSDHIKVKHDMNSEVFQCKTCHYSTRLKKRLHCHIKHQHSGEVLHCKMCESSFKSRQGLSRHMKYYHIMKHANSDVF